MQTYNDCSIVVWRGVIGKWEHIKELADDIKEVRFADKDEVREYYYMVMRMPL
jgi:hypothetical protein